ncbi:MAG: hypothetical protein J6Q54_07190 [Oscillospiraceae bacterium]|nr:hypothetical protein [Oscillospiraceae bacterium]
MANIRPQLYLLPKVDYSLNEADRQHLEEAFEIFRNSEVCGVELINRIYRSAFSCGDFILEALSEKEIRLFKKGKPLKRFTRMYVPGAVYDRARIDFSLMQTGDMIVSNLYDTPLLYIGGKLYHTDTPYRLREADMELECMQSEIATAVLRPALALREELARTDMEREKDVLTPEQTSLVATAKAYWRRGEWVRYADTRFNKEGEAIRGEFRWRVGCNPPEFCTDSHRGYTNCAAFVYDCYYFGLGFRLPDDMFTTHRLAERSAKNGTQVFCYEREPGSIQNWIVRERVKAEFLSALRPGDILVIRREDGSGHALLYAGDGVVYHSTGKVFDYEKGEERDEASIQRGTVQDYFFNRKLNPRGHVFSVATKLVVVRPLNVYGGGVPEAAQNRVDNLDGVLVSKHIGSVHFYFPSITDWVGFEIALTNRNKKTVTLEVRDELPEQLYYSYYNKTTQQFEIEENRESHWQVTLEPGETQTLCFGGNVKEDVQPGTVINPCHCTVGGVPVPCDVVYVDGKLTPLEAASVGKLYAYWKVFRHMKDTGIPAINRVYRRLLAQERLLPEVSPEEVLFGGDGCFREHPTDRSRTYYEKNPNSYFGKLMVPTFYGGRLLWTPEFEFDRITLPNPDYLLPGDLLIYRQDGAVYMNLVNNEKELYLVDVDMRMDQHSFTDLSWLLSTEVFVLLRPAMLRCRHLEHNQLKRRLKFIRNEERSVKVRDYISLRVAGKHHVSQFQYWKLRQLLGLRD